MTLSLKCLLFLCTPAMGMSLWSEGLPGQGDLSDDYLNPNRFTLQEGSNFLSADVNSSETSPGVFVANEDFFVLVVPSGMQLEAVFLLNYAFSGPNGNKSFIGYQNGPTLQMPPGDFTADSAGQIANFLFGESEVVNDTSSYLFDPNERNLLNEFSSGTGSSTPPLPAGEYAFWAREIEPEIARFTFDFVTTPVPEPSTTLLVALGMGCFIRKR